MNLKPSAPKREWTCLYYLNGQGNLREEMTRHLTRLHNEGTSQDVYAVADLYRSDYQLTSKTALHWFADKLGLQKGLPAQVTQDWRGCGTFVIRQSDQSNPETVRTQMANPVGAEQSQPKVETSSGTYRTVSARTAFAEPDQKLPSQWENLRDFLVENMRQYPSEHVSLTVSTHSNGTDQLLGDRSGNKMSLSDFKRAIQEAEAQTGQEIDVLTLEACKMGNPAVIEQLQQVVPLVVASPELVRAGEAPHAEVLHLLKENPSMSPNQLAHTIEGEFAAKLAGMALFQ